MSKSCHIQLKKVSLEYELFRDRTDRIKDHLLNFAYGRNKKGQARQQSFMALDNVSLSIGDDERVGIMGVNGAGKSSLLKLISGILRPTSGTVSVQGSVQPLVEIGAGFNPEYTGRDNIYLNGYMLGFTTKEIREREQELIDFTEINDFIDVPVKYYSSGMAVRLAFAIATSIRPEILVLDEMLSAGDASFLGKAQQRMNALLENSRILVLVSHDDRMILSMTKRLLLLDRGNIVFDGDTAEGVRVYHKRIQERTRVSIPVNENIGQLSQGPDSGSVVLENPKHESLRSQSEEILPGDAVRFSVDVRTDSELGPCTFAVFFRSLESKFELEFSTLLDQKFETKTMRPGRYRIEAIIQHFWLDSGGYDYHFHVKDISLNILGKSQHRKIRIEKSTHSLPMAQNWAIAPAGAAVESDSLALDDKARIPEVELGGA